MLPLDERSFIAPLVDAPHYPQVGFGGMNAIIDPRPLQVVRVQRTSLASGNTPVPRLPEALVAWEQGCRTPALGACDLNTLQGDYNTRGLHSTTGYLSPTHKPNRRATWSTGEACP